MGSLPRISPNPVGHDLNYYYDDIQHSGEAMQLTEHNLNYVKESYYQQQNTGNRSMANVSIPQNLNLIKY